ncbi:WD40-repeat-containing domain protein [Scleroderma yunnanense]
MPDEKLHVSRKSLKIPAQVTCLASGQTDQLLVGSDDGSVRVYDLAAMKVMKAIRGLAPVSSVVWKPQTESHPGHLFVATGRQVLTFSVHTDKMILTSCDAHAELVIGSDDNDLVNELTINAKGNQLAYCLDSGIVGVIDLSNNKVVRMKQSHDTVCGSVRFIPDRPGELVSGGYDSTLLHFGSLQASVLSRDNLGTITPSSGMSMSPPFVVSLSISSTGIIAAGTADGRVYVGTSGEKSHEAGAGRQKRRRKWEGLRSEGRIIVEVAQGPVTGLTFTSPREFLTCTLLGSVTSHEICGSATTDNLSVKPKWSYSAEDIFKVNAIVTLGNLVIIEGFQEDGGGIIEVWRKTSVNAADGSTEIK